MTRGSHGEKPRWLSRGDTEQPFVATICSSESLDDVLKQLYSLVEDLQIDTRQTLSARAV